MNRERGATAAEYALALGLFALVLVVGVDRVRVSATEEFATRSAAGAPDLDEIAPTSLTPVTGVPTTQPDAEITTTTTASEVNAVLTASVSSKGSKWTMTVTITATNQSGAPLLGATVVATWEPGGNGITSCVTVAPSGKCSVTQDQMKTTEVPSATMTVTSITGPGGETGAGGATITASMP
jgi:Flp pilus assembly pilin Flp